MPSGYWEPHTGSPDWCERNYAWTVWVAEFWNTLSSLPLVFVGAWGIYLAFHYNYGLPFIVGNFVLLFVGIGSTAFHGTLSYEGQCLDELAMIYCALAFMVRGTLIHEIFLTLAIRFVPTKILPSSRFCHRRQ